MHRENSIACPSCGQRHLMLNYEVTYAYSYLLDMNAPGNSNDLEFRPYLYDNRTQKAAHQYIECENCKAKYPCCVQDQLVDPVQIQRILDSAVQDGSKQ